MKEVAKIDSFVGNTVWSEVWSVALADVWYEAWNEARSELGNKEWSSVISEVYYKVKEKV